MKKYNKKKYNQNKVCAGSYGCLLRDNCQMYARFKNLKSTAGADIVASSYSALRGCKNYDPVLLTPVMGE
jgi:hypothetical protein